MVDTEECRRWAHSHPGVVDAVVVVLVLAAFEMPAFDPYRHAGGPWWPLWGLAVSASLLWRRSFPIAVLGVSVGATAGALITRTGPDWGGLSLMAILLGPSVALTAAAAVVRTRVSQRLAAASVAVIVATNFDRTVRGPDVIVAQIVVLVGAWLAGEGIRARRSEVSLLRERVIQRAEQATDDERARIARELHDVVAHQLSVIAVHAGAARLRGDDQSGRAEGLLVIEDASRQALRDLRRALGVLRTNDPEGGISPQPGLDQLDRLADRLRRAGLPLELATDGDLTAVPHGIGLSTYRIVQEALTNVLNHAGRVATTVRVLCTDDELQLDVRNERPSGTRTPCDGRVGHGLIGMRERVGAYGGSFRAGVLATGGFEVTARIPLR